MSRNKLYTERIELCITPEQKEGIEKEAKTEGLTINQLVRDAIDWYLK